jgi:hypothetical protein
MGMGPGLKQAGGNCIPTVSLRCAVLTWLARLTMTEHGTRFGLRFAVGMCSVVEDV